MSEYTLKEKEREELEKLCQIAFDQHGAIAYQKGVFLIVQLFGGGSGTDQ